MNPPPSFREVWFCDFEFRGADGDLPEPVWMVARERRSGRELRLWREDLLRLAAAPFDVGAGSLFVAYFASAELGCFLSLGWPLPANVLDLFVEHRAATNGFDMPVKDSLIGALAWRGLPCLDSARKEAMRQRVQEGSPWSAAEQAKILDYCVDDVAALGRLLDYFPAQN